MLTAAKADLVLTLATQMLNPKSDISESGQVEATERDFLDEKGALLDKEKATVCEFPLELTAMQDTPASTTYFLSAVCAESSLYEMCRLFLLSK